MFFRHGCRYREYMRLMMAALTFVLLAGGCATTPIAPTPTVADISTPTRQPDSSPEAVSSPIPTAAMTPAPTQTSTLLTPAPATAQNITATTVTALQLLGDLGVGRALQAVSHPNGSQLIVVTTAGLAWVSLPSLQVTRFAPISGAIADAPGLAISPDGQRVAVITATGTELRRSANGERLAMLPGTNPRFSPDGQSLATVVEAETSRAVSRIWRSADGIPIATLDGAHPAFRSDGRMLATVERSDAEQSVTRLWNSADWSPVAEVAGQTPVFSSDNSMLATVDGGIVRIWRLSDIQVLRAIDLQMSFPLRIAAAFSADGQTLHVVAGPDLQIWNIADGEMQASFAGVADAGGFPNGRFSPDGAVIATFDNGLCVSGGIRLTRIGDGQLLYQDRRSIAVTFSADGSTAILVTFGGAVRLVDLEDGSAADVDLPGYTHIAFGSGGRTLAVAAPRLGDDGLPETVVTLWSAPDLELRRTLDGDGAPIGLAFDSEGRQIGLTSEFGCEGVAATALVWDLVDGGPPRDVWRNSFGPFDIVWTANPPTDAAAWFAPNNATGRPELQLWSSAALTTTLPLPIIGVQLEPERASVLSFSRDGRRLAVGDVDGKIHLFDVTTAQRITSLVAGGAIYDLEFSQDSALLGARHIDGTINVWRLDPPTPLITLSSDPLPLDCFDYQHTVGNFTFIADNQLLAVGSDDGATFYRLNDGQEIHRIDVVAQVIVVDPTNRLMALVNDERVTLWAVQPQHSGE